MKSITRTLLICLAATHAATIFHGNPQLDSGAIESYVGSGTYRDINYDLEKGIVPDAEIKPVIEGLDNSIRVAPKLPKDMVLYRGESRLSQSGGTMDEIPSPGDIIENKNFLSTSAQQSAAMKFVTPKSLLWEIHLPQDSSIRGLYIPEALADRGTALVFESDQEILLGRGVKLRVLRVEKVADGNKVEVPKVVAEIVP